MLYNKRHNYTFFKLISEYIHICIHIYISLFIQKREVIHNFYEIATHTVNERGSLKVLDRSFKVLLRTLRFFGVL